jgi:hypothetical protein
VRVQIGRILRTRGKLITLSRRKSILYMIFSLSSKIH